MPKFKKENGKEIDKNANKGENSFCCIKNSCDPFESKLNETQCSKILYDDQRKILCKFLADSGATEHLTHSKIIF